MKIPPKIRFAAIMLKAILGGLLPATAGRAYMATLDAIPDTDAKALKALAAAIAADIATRYDIENPLADAV